MKKILIVFYRDQQADRNTIDEHVYSFKRYADADVWHYNAYVGLPKILASIDFDLVVFHYTFLARRWNGPEHFRYFMRANSLLANVSALKIAFPQDEYIYTQSLCEFFREFRVDAVFTCHHREDWEKVYPKDATGDIAIFHTFTGYVDNSALAVTQKLWAPHSERKFDVGYRARKLPFWIGHQGTLKWRLTEEFIRAGAESDLNLNLSNDPNEVFFGIEWYEFLSSCRVVLGSEGGATLLDPDGRIKAAVDRYTADLPNASFEEVAANCFPGLDGMIGLKALSPRHFEAAITKTCQAMIEGKFEGIFKANIHYIPIKEDFSNLEEVFRKVRDVKYCEEMAERTYKDIVLSGRFSYADFVSGVLNRVEALAKSGPQWEPPMVVTIRARAALWLGNTLFGPNSTRTYFIKSMVFRVLKTLGLVERYRSLRRKFFAWEG